MTSTDSSPKQKPPTTPFPFPTAEHHDAPPETTAHPVTETPSEDAIDHGIEESFPASDPVSVSVSKAVPKDANDAKDEGASKEQPGGEAT